MNLNSQQDQIPDDMQGGIFDGFEGYVTPTREEIISTLTSGMIVPDANVLLNLYRYTNDARADLLNVLDRLSNNLWIPHQVVTEFWRNRESVMRDPGETGKTVDELGNYRNSAENKLQAWANRIFLPAEQLETLVSDLSASFDSLIKNVGELSANRNVQFTKETSADPTLRELERILRGRVGAPFDKKQHEEMAKEGLRRISEKVPPGYKDKKKEDPAAVGDYLVWAQILAEAEIRSTSVLFVTGDVKEDWWREEQGERRGPRIELTNEMRERAGCRLYMLRPTQLLEYAKETLSVDVSDESLRDVDLVDTFVSESEELASSGGWNVESALELFKRLDEQAPVQAEVLRFTAGNNGYAERFVVYDLGDYPDDRSLRGFVRPIKRVCQEMKRDGRIPWDAVDVLDAVYNHDSPDVGWAAGYRMHKDVLSVFEGVLLL